MSTLTNKELSGRLKLADITSPGKATRSDMWNLCLDNGLVEREFEDKKRMTIVKCSLKAAMTLDDEEFVKFSCYVEKNVVVISQLLRRSSLILNIHMLRLENCQMNIPNLYKCETPEMCADTFWKRWLLIGLGDNPVFPDQESEITYNLVKTRFHEPTLVDDIKDISYFDQVLNYAAHTFCTVIETNAWYPIFAKLERLIKIKLRFWEIDSETVAHYYVLKEIRSPIEECFQKPLPFKVVEFIKEVKRRLNASDNVAYIDDKHAKDNMTFTNAFAFNMWMQREFKTHGARMCKVIPVFKVERAHIRLDSDTLVSMFKSLFPYKPAVLNYEKSCMPLHRQLLPVFSQRRYIGCLGKIETEAVEASKKEYYKERKKVKNSPQYIALEDAFIDSSSSPDADELMLRNLIRAPPMKKLKKNCNKDTDEWNIYQATLKKHETDVRDLKVVVKENAAKISPSKKSKAPHKLMLKTLTHPIKKLKKHCNKDTDEWDVYQAALKKYKKDVQDLRETPTFVECETKHKAHDDAGKAMIQSFFTRIRKKDWKFDCSIITDGIAISRQFSHSVRIERTPPPNPVEQIIVEDYAKNLSCYMPSSDTLVLGLDPGRVNLAFISYIWIKDDGSIEKNAWKFTRSQYYSESGITKEMFQKAKRLSGFKWNELGTMRPTDATEVIAYVDQYNKIKTAWWRLALDKLESKAKLRVYSGKQSSMSKFFANVKKDVKELHPKTKIVIAYGSAYKNMKCNGFGEVSAPLGATFKTCKQYFDVEVTNEAYTTKIDYETSKEALKVYKKLRYVTQKDIDKLGNSRKREKMQRTFDNAKRDGKQMISESFGAFEYGTMQPQAKTEEEKALVLDYYKKRKRKRLGHDVPVGIFDNEIPKRVFYPEVRGLRFCPECRMYVDRDQKSSQAIARLAVMKMTSNTRPQVFAYP